MAVIVNGSWSGATPSPKNELVNKVTRLYGLEGDSELRDLACKMLDETVREMNSWTYEANKMVIEGLQMTQNESTISLPTGFYKESQAMMVDSSGNSDAPLFYLPWVHFERTYNATNTEQTGIPYVYSMRNVQREGELHLFPKPNTDTADNWTLKLEYYRRVPLVSEEDPLELPPEVEAALVFGAQKRMAIHIKGPGDRDVAALDALEQRALERFASADSLSPDANIRFRLIDRSRRSFRSVRGTRTGVLYIG